MNLSNVGSNSTTAVYRDTISTAVIKNVITVALCISINYVNGTLVHTFNKHQIFKMNPRYILFIHLVINDMILLTLSGLIQVLSYILFTLNVSLCIFLLMFAIFANLNTPLTLAIWTVQKTYAVICLIWVLSTLSILPDLFVTLVTEPLEFFRSRVFCLRETIFRNPYLTEKRDVSYIVFLVLIWLILFYTYFKILFAAKAAAADAKKARNTVLLHGFQLLLCMLTYVCHLVIKGVTYLFPTGVLAIRFTIYILIQILPRLISPVIYGLRDKTFSKYLKTWLTLFYTYFRILFAAKAAAADAKKAKNTVLLHGFQLVLCMLTYVVPLMIKGLTLLFPEGSLVIRFTLSVFIQILPRLISPIVYGLRDNTFRKYLKKYFFCKECIRIQPQTTVKPPL
ncbi:odorant receptor 131-2-like [Centroberyx gerrardi]|uniref:odorant receptor 131-2-like n=1 Tax=Centroberyx gerrardi TaxID=166262 RepID=UPI003AB002E8